jgi:hypothetical protein
MTIVTNAVHELLSRAQDLIRDPEHWLQDNFAQTTRGQITDPTDPEATCFCSLGALWRTSEPCDTRSEARRWLTIATTEADPYFTNIAAFNDLKTHDQVMAVWDRAKELALA